MTTKDDWFTQAQVKRRAAEKRRRRLDRIILGTLAAVILGAGVFLYVVGGEKETRSPTGGGPAVSTTLAPATPSDEQALTDRVAKFIGRNPVSDRNRARLAAIIEESGCEVTALDVSLGALPGLHGVPGTYTATGTFGPKYTESEGLQFVLAMTTNCP